MKRYVLDASALMTLFDGRPGADRVREFLLTAADAPEALLMSVVNWGEVYYTVWRGRGEKAASEKLDQIGQLPIELVEVDAPSARLAATLKAKLGLPYADCFAAALASLRRAAVVTADADFEVLKDEVEVVRI